MNHHRKLMAKWEGGGYSGELDPFLFPPGKREGSSSPDLGTVYTGKFWRIGGLHEQPPKFLTCIYTFGDPVSNHQI